VRVLLDENLPRRLAPYLAGDHDIQTVQSKGWTGKRNGELLRLAESDFDVFLTMDRGLEYQQNLSSFILAIVLIRAKSNRLSDLLPIVPLIQDSIKNAAAGQLVQVPSE
jgi:predicted nuclease of predicted toxin-antitoxin system